MKQFTVEEIQDKFDNLPKELQTAISSPDVSGLIKAIADRHALQIDQFGELVDLVGLVLLGLVSSKDFVRELMSEADIGEDVAREVAEDINREVFAKIRTFAREAEEKEGESLKTEIAKPNHIRDIEKAGGFTIEHESAPIIMPKVPDFKRNFGENSVEASNTNLPIATPVQPINRPAPSTSVVQNLVPAKEANGISNIVAPARTPVFASQPVAETAATPEIEIHKEPLADQLLGMLTNSQKKEPQKSMTEQAAESSVPSNLPTEETIEKSTPEPLVVTEPAVVKAPVSITKTAEYTAPIVKESPIAIVPPAPISKETLPSTAATFIPKAKEMPTGPTIAATPKITNNPPKSNWPDAYREAVE